MSHIFLSYSHKDASQVAGFLYSRLTGAGYEVWQDDHSLHLGDSFPREISNALGKQDHFIILLTTAALESNWVKDEIDMAIVAQRHIIPIILEDLEIPLCLRKIHCLFMKEGIHDWMALHKLVDHLDGNSIPRVYNMSGHKDIEVRKILVLGHCDFGYVDLTDPMSISNAAMKIAQLALPFIKWAGAGIVPHGHPALACSILAYLLGLENQMPRLFYTHKFENGKFGIDGNKAILLQNVRDAGFEYRSQNL